LVIKETVNHVYWIRCKPIVYVLGDITIEIDNPDIEQLKSSLERKHTLKKILLEGSI
jgi:hypothetical protein